MIEIEKVVNPNTTLALIAIAEQLKRIADWNDKSDKFDLKIHKLKGINKRALGRLRSLSQFEPDAHGDIYRTFAKKALEELEAQDD